jgi:hypothetical protein
MIVSGKEMKKILREKKKNENVRFPTNDGYVEFTPRKGFRRIYNQDRINIFEKKVSSCLICKSALGTWCNSCVGKELEKAKKQGAIEAFEQVKKDYSMIGLNLYCNRKIKEWS